MTTKNLGTLIGRLAQDVKFADNKDGSRKAYVTLAVERDYKTEDGTRPVDYIQVEGFLPATKSGNGVYEHMKQGDLVSIAFSVRPNSYEKDGEKVYVQKLIVEGVDLLHTKREAKA
mgnify:FL=1